MNERIERIERVTTAEMAQALARRLNDTNRTRPIIVVSVPTGRATPYVDVDAVADEVGDVADVVLIATGDASWAFTTAMPDHTQVYGGAGRSYPVGTAWTTDLRASPLRFAYDDHEGIRTTRRLVEDGLHHALSAGLLGRTTTDQVTREVDGVVTTIVAGRAIVSTPAGPRTVVAELVAPGIAIEQLLVKGMTVRGPIDDVRLDIRAMVRPPSELSYRTDDLVLARVDEVGVDKALLRLHPDLTVSVTHDDVSLNDLDTLDALLTPGEVVRAHIASTSPWKLRLWDVDDDEPTVPAFTLLPGGPAWLVEGLPLPDTELVPGAVVPTPDRPTPPTAQLSVASPPAAAAQCTQAVDLRRSPSSAGHRC